MSASPAGPAQTPETPETSAGTAASGIGFVFRDAERLVGLRLGPGLRERVYVDGDVVADERSSGLAGTLRFAIDGVRYSLHLTTRSLAGGRLHCALRRDGVLVERQYATARNVRPGIAAALFLGVLLMLLSPTLLEVSHWWPLLAVPAYLASVRINQRFIRFDVHRGPRAPWASDAARLGALRRTPRWLRGLQRTCRSLRTGFMLVRGWRVAHADLRPCGAQVLALAALLTGLTGAEEFMRADPPRALNEWGLMYRSTHWLVFFGAVFCLAHYLRLADQTLWLTVALLAATLWAQLLLLLAYHVLEPFGSAVLGWSVYAGFLLLLAAVTVRALRALVERPLIRLLGPVTLYVAALAGASLTLPYAALWYTAYDGLDTAAYTPAPPVDTEGIYYRQPRLVADALDALAGETPSAADVYFVGFAGYAGQDVFRKEVAFVRDAVERHFAERGRSLNLVNHLDTVESVPLANRSNLEEVLLGLGGMMNVEEDVLFLYLTSHGSRDAVLSVDFEALNPNQLDAATLRRLLDASGIRWRIVVVSACFSGTFIDALADPHTLVLTAAHRDNTSFGCSNDRELTYFAEHLFAQELDGGTTLLDAFDRARRTLESRELAEGHKPSNPQRHLGEAMSGKLRGLEARAGR